MQVFRKIERYFAVFYDGTRKSLDELFGPNGEPFNAGPSNGLAYIDYTDDVSDSGVGYPTIYSPIEFNHFFKKL